MTGSRFSSAAWAALAAMFLLAVAPPVAADGGGMSGAARNKLSDANDAIRQESYQAAIDELMRLDGEEPGDADVLNLLGFAHRKLGRFDDALAYYQQALAKDPKHRGAREYLGELYLQTGKLDKAEAEYEVLRGLCWFCSEKRELAAAIEDYRQANGLD